jgi:hypothetical protein
MGCEFRLREHQRRDVGSGDNPAYAQMVGFGRRNSGQTEDRQQNCRSLEKTHAVSPAQIALFGIAGSILPNARRQRTLRHLAPISAGRQEDR